VRGGAARAAALAIGSALVVLLMAGPAMAKSVTPLSSLVIPSLGPGYAVVSQGPLNAGTIATSSPNPAVAAETLSQLSKTRSITTYERVWKDAGGNNEVQDLVVHFTTVASARAFFAAVRHSLTSGEIVSAGSLPDPAGAFRTTYFASTATQEGVGQAITMRSGLYVDNLSFFSSNAASNAQPISTGNAQRVAEAQYAALSPTGAASGPTPAHKHGPKHGPKHGHTSSAKAWFGAALVVVLGVALMYWVWRRSAGPAVPTVPASTPPSAPTTPPPPSAPTTPPPPSAPTTPPPPTSG
jgi:hypothetical protein